MAREGLGFRFDPAYPVQAEMAKDLAADGYEPTTWQAIRSILKAGDHAVDVGAHVGVLTCLMAACVGNSGRVDAFEPDEYNRAKLAEHLALNHFTQVCIHPEAVGEKDGRITFYQCADNDGGHARWNPGLLANNTASQKHPSAKAVPIAKLDTLLYDSPPVALIKSDTEGADFQVLQGAERIIDRDHPAIITEIHRFGMLQHGFREEQLRRWLEAKRYTATLLGNDGTRPLLPEEVVITDSVFNLLFQ